MPKRAYNKTLLQIFLAFVLVSGAILIPGYIVLRNTMLDMFRQMDNNNKLVIRGISQAFDKCSKEANNILTNIKALPFDAYDPAQPKQIDWSNAYIFESSIDNMISNIEYIEDVIVLYYGSDTVITSKGTFNARELFESKYRNGKYAYEFWKNFAAVRHPQKYIPLDTYIESTSSGMQIRRELLFIVGSNRLDSVQTCVLVLVDVNKLLSFIDGQNLASGTSFVILDQDRNMLACLGSSIDEGDIQELYFDSNNDSSYNKAGFEYYYVKLDYNNLTFIYKVHSKSRGIFNVLRSNRVVIAMALILGIGLTVLLTLGLYRPVKRILELTGNSGVESTHDKYSQICRGIEQIKKENEMYRNYLGTADDEIRRSIFYKLTGHFMYDSELKRQADRYFNNIFNCSCFVMVSFLLEPADSGYSGKDRLEDLEVMCKAFSEKVTGMFSDKTNTPVLLQISVNELITIIGFSHEKERELFKEHMGRDFPNLIANISKEYTITLVISSMYTGMTECRHAFKEIRHSQAYRNILPGKTIIDASNPEFTYESYFPADMLNKLTNFLISGNREETFKIVDHILKENLEINTNRIKLINIAGIISDVLIKTISVKDYDKELIIKLEHDCYEKLSNTCRVEEMRKFLHELVELAVPRMQPGSIQKLDRKSVVKYINLHYTEELYLDKMAEVFGTTPKYFSYLFKKTFNVNFIEYLNNVRISKAKDLLISSSSPVNEISEKVGYLSTGTFINAFKRCCGVLPTEYRKAYAGEAGHKHGIQDVLL